MSPFLSHPAHFAVPSMASLSETTRCRLCGCLVFSPPLFKHHCYIRIMSPPTPPPTPSPMTPGKAKALIPGK